MSVRQPAITFDAAAGDLEAVLRGTIRGAILDALIGDDGPEGALARLRHAMHTHTFPAASGPVKLRRVIDSLDARTRREGLHVLQGWDYVAHRFPDDIAPVLMLDYCARAGAARDDRKSLAILLDQYFLAALSLLAVRAWDDGDANQNLDRVSALLRDLGGPNGSGHRFIDDAETLLLLAVSYFHPEERGYDSIRERINTLDAAHQVRCALPCASIMASHLRWGLRFMYRREVGLMRKDNEVDYRWLLFSLLALMRAYSRMHNDGVEGVERERVVEGLLNGLSADPWAFIEKAPAFLRVQQAEHDLFRELLGPRRDDLLKEFESQRPGTSVYSPLAFATNFLSNTAVAMVIVALVDEQRHPSLDSLLATERARALPAGSVERLSRELMAYSMAAAERLGGGAAPLIVVDPYDAVHCFNAVMRGAAGDVSSLHASLAISNKRLALNHHSVVVVSLVLPLRIRLLVRLLRVALLGGAQSSRVRTLGFHGRE